MSKYNEELKNEIVEDIFNHEINEIMNDFREYIKPGNHDSELMINSHDVKIILYEYGNLEKCLDTVDQIIYEMRFTDNSNLTEKEYIEYLAQIIQLIKQIAFYREVK